MVEWKVADAVFVVIDQNKHLFDNFQITEKNVLDFATKH